MAELLNITDKKTPEGKGFRTFYQSGIAVVGAYLYGLWKLPGVSEYTHQFLETQGVDFLLLVAASVGIPAGLIAWWQNRRNK